MLPFHKTSKSRKGTRRAHHAVKAVQVVHCPKCGQSKQQTTLDVLKPAGLSLTPAANGQTQITFVLTQGFGGAPVNLAVVVDGSSSAPVPLTVR